MSNLNQWRLKMQGCALWVWTTLNSGSRSPKTQILGPRIGLTAWTTKNSNNSNNSKPITTKFLQGIVTTNRFLSVVPQLPQQIQDSGWWPTDNIEICEMPISLYYIKILAQNLVETCNMTRDHSLPRKMLPNSVGGFAKFYGSLRQNRPNSAVDRGLPFTSKLRCLIFNYWRLTLYIAVAKWKLNYHFYLQKNAIKLVMTDELLKMSVIFYLNVSIECHLKAFRQTSLSIKWHKLKLLV